MDNQVFEKKKEDKKGKRHISSSKSLKIAVEAAKACKYIALLPMHYLDSWNLRRKLPSRNLASVHPVNLALNYQPTDEAKKRDSLSRSSRSNSSNKAGRKPRKSSRKFDCLFTSNDCENVDALIFPDKTAQGSTDRFQVVAQQKNLIEAAHQFSRKNFFPEVTKFLCAVLEYKHACRSLSLEEQYLLFSDLVNRFVIVGSEYEVNISCKMRLKVIRIQQEKEKFVGSSSTHTGQAVLFDEIYNEVQKLFWESLCAQDGDENANLILDYFRNRKTPNMHAEDGPTSS